MKLKRMKPFGRISEIKIGEAQTWDNKIFLTFDTDWAADEIIADTASLIRDAGITSTWFCTHKTDGLTDLKANPLFEIGLHPNFNPLLKGDNNYGKDTNEIIENLLNLYPQAKSIRSHSLTQSTHLLDIFAKHGITHEVNHFIPAHANIELKPWELWNGIIKVPYFWEDDVHLSYNLSESILDITTKKGLKIFAFHPIHVFLNTECIERYQATRSLHNSPKQLIAHRYKGYGTRSRLLELIKFQ